MSDELTHLNTVIPNVLTRAEFEAVDAHILDNGVQGDFVYWDTASGSLKRIAHASDLSAHLLHQEEQILVGNYLTSPHIGTLETKILQQYRLFALYIIVPRDLTVDRITVNVTTLDIGKTARLGIYNCDSSLQPSSLVLDCGTVSTTNVAVVAAVIDQALTKGRYYLAVISDSAGVARLSRPLSIISSLGMDATLTTASTGYYKAQAAPQHGALPDPFPTTLTEANNVPLVALRVKSFD